MTGTNDHGPIDQHARDQSARVLARLERHEDVCSHMRRSQSQWQESAIRILDDIKNDGARRAQDLSEKIATHIASDLEFQKDIYVKISGWNQALFRIMVSIIAGCFVIIGAFTWHAMFTH